MKHRSVFHTIEWKANGDVSVLLLGSGAENPEPSEIARVFRYFLRYGRKGVEQPKIQRDIWRGAVLGYGERSDAKEICTKFLNTTAARRMITKAACMVEAGNLPLAGCAEKFRKVSLSSFRKLQKDCETGTHATTIDKYRSRSVEDGHVSLYEYVCRSGGVPVFYRGCSSPEVPAFRRFRARDASSAQAVA